jgi:phage-related minor tail protein
MAIAGDVLIKLAADFADFAKGMDESKKKLEEFSEKTASAGERIASMVETVKHAAEALGVMWAVDKVLEFGREIENTASQINTLSKNLELTTDQVQALQIAAQHAGVGQEQMTSAVSRFNAVIGEAVLHNNSAIDTFDKLKVKLLDVNHETRPTADVLQEVAQKLLALKDPAERAALETQLFGKAGKDTTAMLQDWAKGTAALQDQYRKEIFPPETIQKLEEFKTRSEEARREIEVRVAPWWEGLKSNVLEVIYNLLKSCSCCEVRFSTPILQQDTPFVSSRCATHLSPHTTARAVSFLDPSETSAAVKSS